MIACITNGLPVSKDIASGLLKSIAMTEETVLLCADTLQLAAGLLIYEKAYMPILNLSVTIPDSIRLLYILSHYRRN
jgi:uncharacterized protein YfaA (DUF2138 family)